MLMMNRTLCGLGIPCLRTNINSDFFFHFTDNAADYLHGWRQRRRYGCGTCMSQVWSFVCGNHPTLSPSSQVPRALDPARVGRCHAYVIRAAFQLGRHVSHPITLQYLQRNYHVIKPASLVLALGYFDELREHVLGGTGWSVAMAQLLLKPLYVFDLDMEQWYWWNPTLQQYQPCKGMTEEQISLTTLQDKTAIVRTREEDAAVYPTLNALFQRS